jgi:hypothetical protein
MLLVSILRWEGQGFLYLLAAILAYKLLTRQISLGGLFARKGDGAPVSQERIQLLGATLAVSGMYLSDAMQSTNGNLPDVSPQLIYVFAASSGIYASVKAFTTFKGK